MFLLTRNGSLYNGNLPDMSPYPRDGIPSKQYWRVAVSFGLAKYHFFKWLSIKPKAPELLKSICYSYVFIKRLIKVMKKF